MYGQLYYMYVTFTFPLALVFVWIFYHSKPSFTFSVKMYDKKIINTRVKDKINPYNSFLKNDNFSIKTSND